WEFSPGGSIAVTGGIPALGIAPGSVLLSGTFADTPSIRPLDLGDLKVEGAGFLNLVNPQLASYFGLPTGTTAYFGGLSAILTIRGDPGSSSASDGLTSSHLVTSPVSDPRTIALYGLTLLGLTILGRRAPVADRPA